MPTFELRMGLCVHTDHPFSLPEIFARFNGQERGLQKLNDKIQPVLKTYGGLNRTVLTRALTLQNEFLNNHKVNGNISALNSSDTYTVCTGHQLCVCGGPLYFHYKILTIIKLAEKLAELNPGKKIIPVFWMASEDHDVEEISSFDLFGKNYKWNTDQTGAVGRFNTRGIGKLLEELKQVRGNSPFADEFLALCEKAYAPGNSLVKATRILVNEWFGDYGVVCIDGDDPELKRLFSAVMQKELQEQVVYNIVSENNKRLLQEGIKPQVNPREINLFYLSENGRKRITKKEDGNFYEHEGIKKWSREEILEEVNANPQNFSPNVLMRPLYQQIILPNAVYAGGPAEIAYWMQLPGLFENTGVTFPLIVPRASAVLMDEVQLEKIKKTGFSAEDMFRPVDELVNELVAKKENMFDLEKEKVRLQNEFRLLGEKIKREDTTLEASVQAEWKSLKKFLESLEGKMLKSARKKHQREVTQLKNLKEKLFPGGEMQERSETIIPYYWKYGKEIFSIIANSPGFLRG